MSRIAAPMVGGMVSATLVTLVVLPAVWSLWKEAQVRRAARAVSEAATRSPMTAETNSE